MFINTRYKLLFVFFKTHSVVCPDAQIFTLQQFSQQDFGVNPSLEGKNRFNFIL